MSFFFEFCLNKKPFELLIRQSLLDMDTMFSKANVEGHHFRMITHKKKLFVSIEKEIMFLQNGVLFLNAFNLFIF